MIDFTTIETHNVTQSNLRDWTANLSSDVVDLPAGPLGVAVGWERLDNYGYFHPDALIAAGETTTNKFTPTNGRVVRDAEFAELNIPLLGDLPGVKSLSVDVANRWTQYKRAGGTSGHPRSRAPSVSSIAQARFRAWMLAPITSRSRSIIRFPRSGSGTSSAAVFTIRPSAIY
jgi:hypothetical protein